MPHLLLFFLLPLQPYLAYELLHLAKPPRTKGRWVAWLMLGLLVEVSGFVDWVLWAGA